MKEVFTCKSVGLLQSLSDTCDILQVTMENGRIFIVYDKYEQALELIGLDVEGIVKFDLYDGKSVQVLSDITIFRRINTFERSANKKLFSDISIYSASTVSFLDCEMGQSYPNEIVFCVKQEHKESARASWWDLKVQDKDGRIATLYWFSPPNFTDVFTGQYVVTNLIRTEYGFQTVFVETFEAERIGRNPDIDLAYNYILSIMQEDGLDNFNAESNYLDSLLDYSDDSDIVKGSILVPLAQEIFLCREMANINPLLDVTLMTKALLLTRAYALRKGFTTLSPQMSAVIASSKYAIAKDRKIQNVLDPAAQVILLERVIIQQIQELVKLSNESRVSFIEYKLNNDQIWKI